MRKVTTPRGKWEGREEGQSGGRNVTEFKVSVTIKLGLANRLVTCPLLSEGCGPGPHEEASL